MGFLGYFRENLILVIRLILIPSDSPGCRFLSPGPKGTLPGGRATKRKYLKFKVVIMTRINNIKIEALKQTQAFYIWELKKKNLTENERSKYLSALRSLEKIIKERGKAGEIGKHKKIIPYDHKVKAIFQNSKRGY